MEPYAVFHADLADGPPGGRAWRVTAEDGVALRVVTWAAGDRGTVLIFPGRNEHAEKYGRVARDLARRGWSSAVIDWRGQGHSDRLPGAGVRGHVERFTDYQRDVVAMVTAVGRAGLPGPCVLLAHSMGGTIGYRALAEGLPVAAAAFSAPMWGLGLTPHFRLFARGISAVGRRAGLGLREVPAGRRDSYLVVTPYHRNVLTTCEETYGWMVAQPLRDPNLALGRPTLQWLDEAMGEIRRLPALPRPTVPALIGIAGDESIVDNAAIQRLVDAWPESRAEVFPGARHELLMERPVTRDRFLDAADALFREAVSPPLASTA